ncbi:MAG: hypothetical protein K0Q68_334 [Moraxellaceae bacterium]|jgi:hypothetical protein|nr:hypothetical protein [Moraxellaceae bacterium]
MPDVFEIKEYPPFANLIICGEAETGIAGLAFGQEDLPAYQALTPGAEPSAGLPCIRLTLPRSLAGGTADDPLALPADHVIDTNEQTLAEIMSGIGWVTLVIGTPPDSLLIALVIARHAKARGNLVTVFQNVPGPLPHALRQALLDQVDQLFPPAAGLRALDAAQALWSTVNAPTIICIDFEDFSTMRGTGEGHVLWMPLADTGEDRMRDMMTSLPPYFAGKWLCCVLVMPETIGLDEYTIAGEHLAPFCSEEAMVIVACPLVRGLSYGAYIFLA